MLKPLARCPLLCLLLCPLVGCALAAGHGCDFNAQYINRPAAYWPTELVPGKVFDVDLDDQRFDLVKNVVYDAQTGEGMARHCVHWSEQTVFVRSEPIDDFSGIDGAVVARIRVVNDNTSGELRTGGPFTVSAVTLFPEAINARSIACEPGESVGVFYATGARSGRFEIDRANLEIELARRGASVVVETPFEPQRLSEGDWSALVSGEAHDGRFVADRVVVSELPDPTAGDDPALPRVLIIGDSISMNYNDALVAELDGVANVHRCEGNSFSTFYGMQYADYWLGDFEAPGRGWDVIQFNHGLHDLKQPGPDAPYATPIEDYKRNLRRIITRLRQTDATLIFCTTTPVPMSSSGRYGRQQGAEIVFNEAALEVLGEFPEIRVTDLCAVVNGSDVFDAGFRSTADVHYYRPQEQAALAEAVAGGIRAALEARE